MTFSDLFLSMSDLGVLVKSLSDVDSDCFRDCHTFGRPLQTFSAPFLTCLDRFWSFLIYYHTRVWLVPTCLVLFRTCVDRSKLLPMYLDIHQPRVTFIKPILTKDVRGGERREQ